MSLSRVAEIALWTYRVVEGIKDDHPPEEETEDVLAKAVRRDTVKCYCIAQRCTTSVVVSPSEAECIAHERSTVRTIKLTEPADRTIKS